MPAQIPDRRATHAAPVHGAVQTPSCDVAATTIRDVPATQWHAFFERFSREHRAWRATVHGVAQGVPITRVPSVALESVTLERHVPDLIVRLRFANGISLCTTGPRAVRVEQTDDGAECALEVDAADDAFVRVAFRATALPEQLDGVAPGEVA
jgi:hypothetical protein